MRRSYFKLFKASRFLKVLPVNKNMLKVKNRNTRKRCEKDMFKVNIETAKRRLSMMELFDKTVKYLTIFAKKLHHREMSFWCLYC